MTKNAAKKPQNRKKRVLFSGVCPAFEAFFSIKIHIIFAKNAPPTCEKYPSSKQKLPLKHQKIPFQHTKTTPQASKKLSLFTFFLYPDERRSRFNIEC